MGAEFIAAEVADTETEREREVGMRRGWVIEVWVWLWLCVFGVFGIWVFVLWGSVRERVGERVGEEMGLLGAVW